LAPDDRLAEALQVKRASTGRRSDLDMGCKSRGVPVCIDPSAFGVNPNSEFSFAQTVQGDKSPVEFEPPLPRGSDTPSSLPII
jgi:hypothetical protein